MTLADRNFLAMFEIHLKRINPYITLELVLEKFKNKKCIFSGFLSHFRGDEVFRENRRYMRNKKSRELVTKILEIINQVYKDDRRSLSCS